MSLGALTEPLSTLRESAGAHASSLATIAMGQASRLPSTEQPIQSSSGGDRTTNGGPPATDPKTARAVRELLDLLPKDVVEELNNGKIDVHDPAFLDGLTDHVSRLSLADPREGRRIVGKVIKLKKRIARDLRASDPEVAVSSTISRTDNRVGRNDRCPCGSGKKFKQCCMRKP